MPLRDYRTEKLDLHRIVEEHSRELDQLPGITLKYGREENYKERDSSYQANKAKAGKRNESVDSLDRDMGTKQGMLNSNKTKKIICISHLTYSIDL